MSIPLSMLPHTCTIVRRTQSGTNALGQPVFAWAELATGVRCAFHDKGTREVAGRYIATIEHPRLYLLPTQDVAMDDIIRNVGVFADGAALMSGEYRVIGVANPGGLNHHLEAELEAVGNG